MNVNIVYCSCPNFVTDDDDINGFDYQRYHMEEIDLQEIVDNPASSLVMLSLKISASFVLRIMAVLRLSWGGSQISAWHPKCKYMFDRGFDE